MDDDTLEWVSLLPRLDVYDAKDRYHDFRKVFMGSPEGKRALSCILRVGCVFSEPRLVSPVDSHMLAAQRGKRQLALEILSFVSDEPKEKQQRARSKE